MKTYKVTDKISLRYKKLSLSCILKLILANLSLNTLMINFIFIKKCVNVFERNAECGLYLDYLDKPKNKCKVNIC